MKTTLCVIHVQPGKSSTTCIWPWPWRAASRDARC